MTKSILLYYKDQPLRRPLQRTARQSFSAKRPLSVLISHSLVVIRRLVPILTLARWERPVLVRMVRHKPRAHTRSRLRQAVITDSMPISKQVIKIGLIILTITTLMPTILLATITELAETTSRS